MKPTLAPAPQRILMTTATLGGVWHYSVQLCHALADHGVQVVLAAMGGVMKLDQRRQAARLENVELAESPLKLEGMAAPWEDVDRAGEWLLALERRFQPQIVHLNGYALAACPFRAPKLVVAHSCVLSWWRAVKDCDAPSAWRTYARRVAAGLHAADLVVAPTRAMLHAMKKLYGPLRRSQVICNGRDPPAFTVAPKEQLILSAARIWDDAKVLSDLAQIAGGLPWPVAVAGDATGPDGQPLRLPNLRMLGPLTEKELAACYARAAIYALPARYEPFGLSALEAALSGSALVLGDIPSLRELWKGAAVFVPPGDQAALRDSLLGLIQKPARRLRLAKSAQRRALTMSGQRMGQAYLAAYSGLAKARVRSAYKSIARSAEALAACVPAELRPQPQ